MFISLYFSLLSCPFATHSYFSLSNSLHQNSSSLPGLLHSTTHASRHRQALSFFLCGIFFPPLTTSKINPLFFFLFFSDVILELEFWSGPMLKEPHQPLGHGTTLPREELKVRGELYNSFPPHRVTLSLSALVPPNSSLASFKKKNKCSSAAERSPAVTEHTRPHLDSNRNDPSPKPIHFNGFRISAQDRAVLFNSFCVFYYVAI